ncbi:MAG TPA: tetratricopeptide repeat protein [Planctomycetota bacterium]|jgi:tetratricopeptide (TPR) repeat protein|nr:tetratricopeptide repeat protein [Planctomycetota bacterium]
MTSSAPKRPNLVALLLSPIAGLGHLVLGRSVRGFFLLMGATFGWNLVLLYALKPSAEFGTWTLRAGLALALTLSAYSIMDVFKIGVWNRTRRMRDARNRCFLSATDAYLQKDWRGAREHLDPVLDMDPGDAAARLFLATIERRAERFDQAIKQANKALRACRSSPFVPELEREIHLAREARRRRRRRMA